MTHSSQSVPTPLPGQHYRWQGRYRYLVERGAILASCAAVADMWGTGGVAPLFCLASNLVTVSYLKMVDIDKRIERIHPSKLTDRQKKYLSFVERVRGIAQKNPLRKYTINRKYFAFRSSQVSQVLNLCYALAIYSTTPVGACLVLYACGRLAQTQATIAYNNLSEAEKNDHTRHRTKRMLSNLSGTTGALEVLSTYQYAMDAAASFASGNVISGVADLVFLAQCGYNARADLYQFRGVDMAHYKDWHKDWSLRRKEHKDRKAASCKPRSRHPEP